MFTNAAAIVVLPSADLCAAYRDSSTIEDVAEKKIVSGRPVYTHNIKRFKMNLFLVTWNWIIF